MYFISTLFEAPGRLLLTKLMNYGCGNAGGAGGGGGALIQMARARCSRHKRRVSPICYHTTLNPSPGTGDTQFSLGTLPSFLEVLQSSILRNSFKFSFQV